MAYVKRETPVLGWADKKRRVVAASIVVAFVFSTVAIAYMASPAVRQSFVLATSMHPEQYSELYLDNATHLPTSAPAGKPRSFSFRVVNHEGLTATYHYEVNMTVGQKATTVTSGVLVLADGQGKSTTVIFTVPTAGLSPTVQVRLVGRPQTVQFRTQS